MSNFVVSERVLSLITERSSLVGFQETIQAHFSLPQVDLKSLKDRAVYQYIRLPTATWDSFFLARVWIKAYEELLHWAGTPVNFQFPHIDPFIQY